MCFCWCTMICKKRQKYDKIQKRERVCVCVCVREREREREREQGKNMTKFKSWK